MDDSYSTPIISHSIIERNSAGMENDNRRIGGQEKDRHGIASNTGGRSQYHNFQRESPLQKKQVDIFANYASGYTQASNN